MLPTPEDMCRRWIAVSGLCVLLSGAAPAGAGQAAVPANAGQEHGAPLRPALAGSLVGRDSFDAYCAACHGKSATGDGPLAPALRARPSDLTRLAARADGTFPRGPVRELLTGSGRAVSEHGTGDMPIWGTIFQAFESDAHVRTRIANLVAYLESIQVPAPPR